MSVQIPLCYSSTGALVDQGGNSEVWKVEYEGREVAVKVLKVSLASDLAKKKRVGCQCDHSKSVVTTR